MNTHQDKRFWETCLKDASFDFCSDRGGDLLSDQ